MRKTKQEAEETRLRIIQCALELFAEQGISATNLSQIATRAGVTRGAIYWNFKNKLDLFDAVWEFHSKPFTQLGEASANIEEPNPLARLREFWHFLLTSIARSENYQRMFTICQRENTSGCRPDAIAERFRQLQQHWNQECQSALRNAVRREQLPHDLDVPLAAKLVDSLLVGFINNSMHKCRHWGVEMDLDQQAQQVVEAAVAMLTYSCKSV